jgi:outer membrane protein assembly factor BamB
VPARVRVVDGDTKRPVKGALVHVGRARARAEARGVAEFELRRYRRFDVRVAARGYIPRHVSVRFRRRDARADVRIWQRATQWPIYGANPARTQAHPAIKLRPPFRIVWHRWIRSLLEFPAVVWEGVAYVNTYRGDTVAVSMENGRILWRRKVGTTFASSPAVEPKRRELVVTTKVPGRATILDTRTGRIKWRYETGRAEPSPVIANQTAYFGDEDGRMYALDLRRRRARWVYSGGVKITASPALAGGRLYFGDYSGRVVALSARTGRRIWTGSAGSRVYGTAAVAGGRVFVPSVFSGLSALSARTGALLWRIPSGAYTYASPAYHRGRVYFGTYAGIVYSVDARSGRILWTRTVRSAVSGAIVIVAGTVYAASFNHWINAWHWRSGRHLWSINRGEYVPISGNGARLLIHGRSSLTAVAPRRKR